MSIPNPVVLLDARAKHVHPAFRMSRASTKTAFDATGRLVTVPANALGWDHDPATGQAQGYLAEPSATNLLRYSNNLTRSVWTTVNASVSGDATTGPDGNGMAKVVEDTNNSTHLLNQTNITISDGSTVVSSFVAKAEERTAIRAWVMNASEITNNALCNFDLTNGSVHGEAAQGEGEFVGAGTIDLGGGFYRCWLAGRVGPGVTNARVEYRLLPDADSSPEYQGDGTSGLYLGYCQAEEGSYPTSYVETVAATATRAGDSLLLPSLGDFPWWRSERGTLLVDVGLPPPSFLGAILGVDFNLLFLRDTGGRVLLDGTRFLASPNTIIPPSSSPGRHSIAAAWDGTSIAISADGAITVTGDQTGAMNESPNLGLGVRGNGSDAGLAHIHRVVYYPQRLSNADLQSLTAIQE